MKVIVERGVTKKLSELPAYSIALDGYVQGPELDLKNHRISFDHHAGCIRMFTSATCRQVLDALLLGLDPSLYTVYVNEVDGDTALAVWLLENPEHARDTKVRFLVDAVSAMDAHGPAYPPAEPNWVSRFYDEALASLNEVHKAKKYATIDLDVLLAACTYEISCMVFNYAKKIKVRPPVAERTWAVRYASKDKIGGGWVLVESDSYVFDLIYQAGHHVAVAFQKLPDESYLYTIGKRSDLVDFPLGPHTVPGTALYALNAVETGWGGSSSIGGAPRNPDGSRSKLTPTQVVDIINSAL